MTYLVNASNIWGGGNNFKRVSKKKFILPYITYSTRYDSPKLVKHSTFNTMVFKQSTFHTLVLRS